MLPAGASFRIKPQKGCKLLSESWAGGSKCFHIQICFLSTMLGGQGGGMGFGGCPWRGGVGGCGGVCLFLNFLKFAVLAKVCNSRIV